MKEGWKMVKLTDISENLDYMRVPITKNVREVGKYPYYGASGVVDYVNDYIYDEDLLLISEDGANLLARATPIAFSVSGKVWVNNHAHVLRFKSLTTQKFVEYFIAGFNIKPYVTGMAQPKLNQRALEKIKLPLPPLEEQHRIVSILDAAFEKIDKLKANAEENLKNAKALFQQVLAQELKPKEGWVEKKLGEVVVKNEVGLVKNTKEQDARYDYPYLKMGNITNSNYLDMSSMVNVNATKEEVERYSLYYGDFLFNTRNSKELVGKSCVYDKKEGVCLYNNNIIRFTFDQIINPFFINYMFGNKIIKEQLERIKKGTTNVWAIYYKDLKDIILSFPTISEQQRIVQTLDTLSEKCRRLETIAQQTIRECDALKQSILRQAFSGEL